MKHALHQEIWRSFKQARSRFLSIMCLMFLGSFALVGLKVVKPNVEAMLSHYFVEYQMMDLAVISDYGLSAEDQQELQTLPNTIIDYGYFTDVVIAHTDTAFRIFSTPQHLSHFQVMEGNLPQAANEIALSQSYRLRYRIGDTITFTQKDSHLSTTQFTITGFVTSPEILSDKAIGTASAGTGTLMGYGVVLPKVFAMDVYTIARIQFKDLLNLSPFSKEYQQHLYKWQQKVDTMLADNGAQRFDAIQSEAQDTLSSAQQAIDSVQSELTSAESMFTTAQNDLDSHQVQINSANNTLNVQDETLTNAQAQLEITEVALQSRSLELQQAQQQLAQTTATLTEQKTLLDTELTKLEQTKIALDTKQTQLEMTAATLTQTKSELDTRQQSLEQIQTELGAKEATHAAAVTDLEQQLQTLIAEGIDPATIPDILTRQTALHEQATILLEQRQAYEADAAQYQSDFTNYQSAVTTYETDALQYATDVATYDTNRQTLDESFRQYEQAVAELTTHTQTYQIGLAEYQAGINALAAQHHNYLVGTQQLQEARFTLDAQQNQLDIAQQVLNDETRTFDEERTQASHSIQDAQETIQNTQVTLTQLAVPNYHTYTRSTFLTSGGYRMISGSVEGIHAVGNLFPVILYLVAALVTMTTMTRFVNEERTQIGILKALGYHHYDILKKFALYGLMAGLIGTILGILAGTYLFPTMLMATLYGNLTLPDISLQFHWGISGVALVSSLICSTLPPLFIARSSLQEAPSRLLLPKPPAQGAKIWLEHIQPLWQRLTFTQKVTCRNMFRYKQRMFMTIFGVAGAVALLFAGLGITNSLNQIIAKQYGDILHYDMIVTHKPSLTSTEQQALQQLLDLDSIAAYQSLYIDHVQLANEQEATLIVAPADKLHHFITLKHRTSQRPLTLDSTSVIVSEHLAEQLNATNHETIAMTHNHVVINAPISDVAEFYAGHFIFMTPQGYAQYFAKKATDNAYLIRLASDDRESSRRLAAQIMQLESVTSLTHNTNIIEQVETVVTSLNASMQLLTAVSIFLAVIILYNLTAINIAERIRELSTIKVLGFHHWETTRYIYRETILLSFIGIGLGILLGRSLHHIMIETIRPDNLMFDPIVAPIIYLIPPAVIIGILVALGAFVHYTLKKLNMLEALKANE